MRARRAADRAPARRHRGPLALLRLRRRDVLLGAAAAGGVGAAPWLLGPSSPAAAGALPAAGAEVLTVLSHHFADVSPGHPFFAEITWVSEQGIALGYPDRTYRPLEPVTRQAMAAFLHRAAGSPAGPFPQPGFTDVSSAHPFRHEIAWLADEGIAVGFSDRTFRPGQPVTRQAMAAFLHRSQGTPAGPFPDPRFSDVSATHPFRRAIHWMAWAGITTAGARFRPDAPVSRQAMAAFLVRLAALRQDEARAFRHGVASGDPLADGAILWTRVSPSPAAVPGSGVGPPATVSWEVAADPELETVVAHGTETTTAARDHTVKVDVRGLEPATTYWFRFSYDAATSPVGRVRTAPAAGASPERLRFGVVSCANLESGHFSAYRHLAERDDLDFVLHLGDYLYEYANGAHGAAIRRQHDPPHELVSLADYRRRHGQYKRDHDLQLLHARHAVVAVLDDHEVANDAWRSGAQNHTPATEGSYASRQAAAYQAYLEYLPIREERPGHVERRLRFGELADLHLLDLRRHRDEPVRSTTDLVAIEDPARTITGAEQMAWLQEGLASPGSPRWRLIGTSVIATPVAAPQVTGSVERALAHLAGSRPPVHGYPFNVDQWDGYAADRERLLGHLVAEGIDDVVFLAGDLHCSWASDVPRVPAEYEEGRPGSSVAAELVVPSVTSDNFDDIARVAPRTTSSVAEAAFQEANPHLKLVEMDSHGYAVVDLTAERLQMDWWYVSDRDDPVALQRFGQARQVVAGTNRVAAADGPVG